MKLFKSYKIRWFKLLLGNYCFKWYVLVLVSKVNKYCVFFNFYFIWGEKNIIMLNIMIDLDVKFGEYVIKSFFVEFVV